MSATNSRVDRRLIQLGDDLALVNGAYMRWRSSEGGRSTVSRSTWIQNLTLEWLDQQPSPLLLSKPDQRRLVNSKRICVDLAPQTIEILSRELARLDIWRAGGGRRGWTVNGVLVAAVTEKVRAEAAMLAESGTVLEPYAGRVPPPTRTGR